MILEKQYGYVDNQDNFFKNKPTIKVIIKSSYLKQFSENLFLDSATIPNFFKR